MGKVWEWEKCKRREWDGDRDGENQKPGNEKNQNLKKKFCSKNAWKHTKEPHFCPN
jgi:hypothetical protein